MELHVAIELVRLAFHFATGPPAEGFVALLLAVMFVAVVAQMPGARGPRDAHEQTPIIPDPPRDPSKRRHLATQSLSVDASMDLCRRSLS
jgi:hypothetical protein